MSDVYFKGIKDIYRMKGIHQRGQPDVIIPGYVQLNDSRVRTEQLKIPPSLEEA